MFVIKPYRSHSDTWTTHTPRGGEKGFVTTPSLVTIVDLQQGPSYSKRNTETGMHDL